MLFTAYLDESDTHGPKPNVIMAGFLGSARQWELFERKIRRMQVRYGFKVFHAKDFKAGAGEFRGWSREKSLALLNELAVAIRDGLEEGIAAVLPYDLYQSEYRAPPIPKGMHLDSQYGLCFRMCLVWFIARLAETKKQHKLHMVIEDGHKNARDTIRIFKETKEEYAELGFDVLGYITIAQKTERYPLMIADLQAHLTLISESRIKAGQPGYFEMPDAELPRKGEASLAQFEFTAETLRQFKANWETGKQARVAEWRAARDARKASPSSGRGQLS